VIWNHWSGNIAEAQMVESLDSSLTFSSANFAQNRALALSIPHLYINNHKGLCQGFTIMYKDRDLFVNRVVLQEHGTFVLEILFYILVLDPFQFQSPLNPEGIRASPEP